MLDAINHGKITISVDGKPLMALDRDAKSLEIELSGLERINMRISGLFVAKKERGRVLVGSSDTVKRFVKNGWRFSLYDKGERLISAGGAARLGPRVRFNPLRLGRILKAV